METGSPAADLNLAVPEYEARSACHQNALDLFKDKWTSSMPVGSGLNAGPVASHFTDARVSWAANVLGGLNGRKILELGPYEGYNTYQMEGLGADVSPVENSSANFLKCLVVKNIFGLRASFLYGDFIHFMEQTELKFDVCWASGVLYHMTDPMRFLKAAGSVSNKLFLWTQYYDATIIESVPGHQVFFLPEKNLSVDVDGREIVLHHRSYRQSGRSYFSGGSDSFSYWMEKSDIFAVLETLGFVDITMGVDNPNFPAGPACFFVASR